MVALKIFRETVLPSTLVNDAMYIIAPEARPDYMELYVTNSSGAVRHIIDQAAIQAMITLTVQNELSHAATAFAITQKVVVVTAEQIVQKSIMLDHNPVDPLGVSLTISGGIQQFSGIDFIVDNRVLSWAQLSLELLIEAGQHLVITYKPTIT